MGIISKNIFAPSGSNLVEAVEAKAMLKDSPFRHSFSNILKGCDVCISIKKRPFGLFLIYIII
jgi:hypothetical protein